MASTLPPGEPFALDALVTPSAQGIASRVLARTAAGNIEVYGRTRVRFAFQACAFIRLLSMANC
jgi:hypothetical protein